MSNAIVVIGGGASGMVAAITAARAGAKVTILEQNYKLGKKILSTGNGHCNMTNLVQKPEFYRSTDQNFASRVFEHFFVEDTLCFFRELGISSKNKNGYIYPRSNQAASVVEVLEMELRRLKIKCKTNETVTKIQKTETGFMVYTKTWQYECAKVILACGSKASVIEGSDGSGYDLAEKLGHQVVTPLPALVGLKGVGSYFVKWAGVRIDAEITLWIEEDKCMSEMGEVQLTDYGISGIPVFQISRFAARGLDDGKKVRVDIDFMPDLEKEQICQFLKGLESFDSNKKMKNLLTGLLPSKLIDVLADGCDSLEKLSERIKSFSVDIKDTLDFSHAQVCCGGVRCDEISSDTMGSKLVPGIYFCGELVDVDGACGGYNLQWAWSSGYLAGASAAKESYDKN